MKKMPFLDSLGWALKIAKANPNFNAAVLPGGLQPSDYNYNMSYQQDPYGTANLAADGSYHLSDIGKLPNHPTFSNESVYAIGGPPSGQWKEMPLGEYTFHNPARGLFYAPEQDAYNHSTAYNPHSLNALLNSLQVGRKPK